MKLQLAVPKARTHERRLKKPAPPALFKTLQGRCACGCEGAIHYADERWPACGGCNTCLGFVDSRVQLPR